MLAFLRAPDPVLISLVDHALALPLDVFRATTPGVAAQEWAAGWPRASACYPVSTATKTLAALREVHRRAEWFALFPYHYLLLTDCLFAYSLEFNAAHGLRRPATYTPLGSCRVRLLDPGALALAYFPPALWTGEAPGHPEILAPGRITRHESPDTHDLLLEPCEAPPPSPFAGLTGDLLVYPPLPAWRQR